MHLTLTYPVQPGGRFFTRGNVRGYCFGFNGKEKVDEVYGDANAYDYGARFYDPRLGRWLAVDPLYKVYPGISPFAGCNNNPIIFIDPDGKKVVYANEDTQRAVESAMASDPEFAKAMQTLMNSDVIYNYTLEGTVDYNVASKGGKVNPGSISSDGAQINIKFKLIENSVTDGKYTSLYHETEHGLQFEHGEIGFEKTEDGLWALDATYDVNDEVKAFEAGMKAPGVDNVAKRSFENKNEEQKINYVARKNATYNALKQQAQRDQNAGDSIDRNQGASPDGEQKTVKTETRFFKSNKKR